LTEKHPDLKTYKTIQTKKGFHIWFRYDADFKTTTDGFTVEGVDIRNDDGIVFAPPTKYFFPDGSVVSYIDLGGELVMPPAYLKDYIKKPTEKKTITIKNNKNVDKPKDIKLNDIVSKLLYHNLLDGQSKGSWDDWRNVALCMKFTTTFEHFDKFSKINKDKYDKEETVSMWNSVNDKYDAMNIGTLMKYAKEYDTIKYNLYFNYYIPLEVANKGALKIAECIAPKLERHLKWSNDTWYMFYNKTNLWLITKEPSHIIIQTIQKHIDYSIQMKIAERSKLEDDDEEGQKKLNEQIKAYSKLYDQVDKSGFYSMITKHLKTILYDKDFYTMLDTNTYEIAFKNGIYDLRTKEFKEGFNDYNYLTSTIDFDYTKPSQEDMDYVKNEVLFKICNANHSHLEYYLRVLGQSITGDAEMEKALYFMVGIGGNNGKTLILEALQDIMPNYVAEIDRKTFEKGYTKAHKHLKNLVGKRIAYVEEMSNKEQDINMLKQLGDGKKIKNEIMYGTDETINVLCKMFFLSNCQANLKVDGGIGNRYRQICHNSSFQPQYKEDNIEKLQFKQNRELAGLLKDKYKHALIQLLMDYAYEYTIDNVINIPEEFEEAIKNTLDMNDEVKCWFDDNCEYGDDFKCMKQELEGHLNKPFRDIQTEIQRITNIKYDRFLRNKDKRGGFKGFRIKVECLLE
jgi:phage/plasmid-associated DNA primase